LFYKKAEVIFGKEKFDPSFDFIKNVLKFCQKWK